MRRRLLFVNWGSAETRIVRALAAVVAMPLFARWRDGAASGDARCLGVARGHFGAVSSAA
jgi:hypothetical protein